MTAAELLEWRNRCGFSNREAAARLGVARRTFEGMLYDNRTITARTAQTAALVEAQRRDGK